MSMLPRAPFASLLLALLFASMTAFLSTDAYAQAIDRPVIDVGVVVSDLDRSVQFYQNVLGMTSSRSVDLDAEFGQRSGLTDARGFHIEALKLEDSEQATEWKLISFKGTPQQASEHIHDQTGLRYVTIRVTSLNPFLERIQMHDVELLGETPIPLGNGNHFALIQDPDGTFIELIGPMDE